MQFEEKVRNHRQTEFERLRAERDERINHIHQQRRQEREMKRKMMFYLKSEEERLRKLQEEEETRKREGKFYFLILVHFLLKLEVLSTFDWQRN